MTARRLLTAVRDDVLADGDDGFVPYLGVAATAIAVSAGDFTLAASLIGFTDRAFRDLGQVPDPDDAQELDAARSTAIGRLGADDYATALAVGAEWGSAQALERI
ncbi:hypothetical protein [Herbiconiux daphne]|uniref:Uncharacterized protein n=1 Tax=Herbiconiux daphne TaxID=2970914 RepID=A0ABT2H0N8_9MICO|nr:hypothetical protein [Herbiconiux daphne]MCS5733496.1 hypothetical protein [Herbiconiux daphne]